MSQTAATMTGFIAETPKPEKMLTLVCTSCRMALYMRERLLEMSTWKCPSCGAVTKTNLT